MEPIGKLLVMEQIPDRAVDRRDEPDDFPAPVQAGDRVVDQEGKGQPRYGPARPMMPVCLDGFLGIATRS